MWRALAVTCVLAAAGCFASGMESAARRTGQNPRSDGVLDLAAKETGCPVSDLRIVAETRRKYINETAFRFVLEGCGERLGFVEQCELGDVGPDSVAVNDSLVCRYILVTRYRPTSTDSVRPSVGSPIVEDASAPTILPGGP